MTEMMDEEYLEIGKVVSNNSFVGLAIVDKEFKITWASKQFRKVLGVMAGDILDVEFTDITPEPYRSLDLKHANLVKQGRIPNYMMDKDFMLPDGRIVPTILLVHGVYCKDTDDFLYFISQLMARDTELSPNISNQSEFTLSSWVDKKKALWTVLSSVAVIIALAVKEFLK